MYSFYLSGYVFIILFLKCQAKRGIVSGFGFLDFRVKESLETDKDIFLKALDTTDTLNLASEKRTSLLNTMIDRKLEVENARELSINNSYIASSEIPIRTPPLLSSRSLKHPGQLYTFSKVATGTWKVIYAPHMTKISGVFGGRFDVSYILYDDLTIESHARYDFPIIGSGYLSTSGTYGSVSNDVSRVNFNKVWFKPLLSIASMDMEDAPYKTFQEVPDSHMKRLINSIGQTFFLESVSVFPVSFLDQDMCVFEFQLLGTRICARKLN